jgi:polyisoprenoid-binding protein YceI
VAKTKDKGREPLKICYCFILLAVFFSVGMGQSYAQESVILGPKETKIDGSIPYSVLGKYRAQFRVFKGKIVLGDDPQSIKSVYLEIKVSSITSNCPWCDGVVRSRKLLNARVFPDIIFKSDKIIHDEGGFKVKGVLEMHGIRRVMTFPFKVEIVHDQKTHHQSLSLHGSWVINRKDFGIIWNKYLDRGGVIVGDDLTVNWGIRI